MTIHTLQQTLANAWHARATSIVGVSLSLAILVGGALAYRSATALRPAQTPALQPAASSTYAGPLAQTGTWDRPAVGAVASSTYAGPLAQTGTWDRLAAEADESTRSPVGPDELAYVSAFMNEVELQRYLAGRQAGFQANASTCQPAGPDERAYVGALLSEAELQRYLAGRQCPPAR
jgi:hypothetical protein